MDTAKLRWKVWLPTFDIGKITGMVPAGDASAHLDSGSPARRMLDSSPPGDAPTASLVEREMNLRYAGICTVCNETIPKGGRAIYNPATKSVRHVVCPADDRGTAGASAMREYERRKAKDEARVQAQTQKVQETYGTGIIGKIATRIAVDDRPRQSTSVWKQGAIGEERLAVRLDDLATSGVVALHDRRIPGTRANIDHLVVTPWEVWAIDAKRYLNKRPSIYTSGGFLGFGATTGLQVGGRKADKLVDGVLWQCEQVRKVLGETTLVRGLLCFIDADWPLIGGDFTIRGVRVCWPKLLPKELLKSDPPALDVQSLSHFLASRFPSA